jgi:hypothetical protein
VRTQLRPVTAVRPNNPESHREYPSEPTVLELQPTVPNLPSELRNDLVGILAVEDIETVLEPLPDIGGHMELFNSWPVTMAVTCLWQFNQKLLCDVPLQPWAGWRRKDLSKMTSELDAELSLLHEAVIEAAAQDQRARLLVMGCSRQWRCTF